MQSQASLVTSHPRKRQLSRDIAADLIQWKNRPHHRPLLIRGARQVGKTWSILDFGRHEYTNTVHIDFLADTHARQLFDGDLDPHTILQGLSLYARMPIRPHTTLVVLDEIQECPQALTALKYFNERASEYDVIASGSYMGVARHAAVSFPVGKVDLLTMHPLSFLEFLDNCGENQLSDLIRHGKIDQISSAFNDRLTSLLRTYLVTGGMPAVVDAYLDTRDFTEVRRVQHDILDAYDLDFSKYADTRLLDRIRLVWRTLPAQLAKENKKYVYGLLRKGARARTFEESIDWLADYGVVHRIPAVSALRLPLTAYANVTSFKLFVSDTGLLSAMADVDPRIVLNGSRVFTEFKGALTEQYVCQQLVAQGYQPFYWADSRQHVETDFDIQDEGEVHPIEVKAGTNVHSASLRTAFKQFETGHAIRTSLAGYERQDWVTNIPLWAIGGLHAYVSQANLV